MHLDKVMQYSGNFLPAFVQGLAGFAQIVATFGKDYCKFGQVFGKFALA